MSQLTLSLLGPPQFILNDAALTLKSNKSLGILTYLAVTGTTQLREHVANLFWGNSTTPGALAALRTVVWKLKHAGLEDFLEIQPNTISLRKGSSFSLDIDLFHSLLDQCKSHGHPLTQICTGCLPILEKAQEIYRGEFCKDTEF